MTARPVKACPSCGKRAAERLIGTGAAVLFKGGGFYETDYRSEAYKKAAEADRNAAAPAEKGTEKPAEKPADAAKPAEPAKSGEKQPTKAVDGGGVALNEAAGIKERPAEVATGRRSAPANALRAGKGKVASTRGRGGRRPG